MQRSKSDVWVGLLVILGAVAFLFLSLQSANLLTLNWHTSYTVTARFDNIGGLKPHAPVKSAGVVIGRVDGIVFDSKDYEAKVTIKLDKRYKFPTDTFANIYTAGLLGEQYIGLEAGGEEAQLKNGDKISHTQDAVVLEKLISQFLYSKASDNKSSDSTKATE